jgi:hypothetical protein
LFQTVKDQRATIEYKKYQENFLKLSEEMIKTLFSNPFSDVLGFAREKVGSISFNKGQFYTPPDISNLIAEIILQEYDDKKSTSFSDPTAGCGSNVLSIMRKRNNPYDYFILIDIDEIALKALFLHIWSSYKVCKKPIPKIDIICGDSLFLKKGHELLFSNINVSIFDVAYLSEFSLYQEEIKKHREDVEIFIKKEQALDALLSMKRRCYIV